MEITDSLINEFKDWCLLGGLSPETSQAYFSTIRYEVRVKTFEEVNDKRFFLNFRQRFQEKGAKLATTNRHIWAIKKFLIFVNQEYQIPIINIFQIHCKKPKYLSANYLEKEEIKRIRELPVEGPMGLRRRALFEFLLFTGCRISEAVGLDWKNIDFERGEAIVMGKGQKQRKVFLGASTGWIKRYLAARRPHEALFATQWSWDRLDRKSGCILIRKMGHEAKIQKRVYPHMVRTTFATHMIRQGVDARTLQEMLGHDDIETTLKHYVGVSQEHMKSVHHSFANYLA